MHDCGLIFGISVCDEHVVRQHRYGIILIAAIVRPLFLYADPDRISPCVGDGTGLVNYGSVYQII